jgi:RNA polymerase sigma-70 factor (ECF subfamily)
MMTIEKLYNENYNKILAFLKTKVRNMSDAEELAQDVFLKANKFIDKYDEEKASVSTWLYTIAKNTLIDYYRINNIITIAIKDEHPDNYNDVDSYIGYSVNVIEHSTPHTEIVLRESLKKHYGLFSKLPISCRRVANMHFNYGMSHKDICVATKIENINTIKSKIYNARNILKKELLNI